ncbi:MAG: hypothetical protein AB2792_19830 [Candidatus Thiodiazotropha sp.]
MAISSYTELKASIAGWLDRDTLTTEIEDFIVLAEGEFNRELRTNDMEYRATTSTTAGTSFYDYPTDAITITNIQLNTDPKALLKRFSKDQLDLHYATGTGQPEAFTINANQIELGPTPDSNYEIEVSFIKEIPSLSTTQTSNWLLEQDPDLYLSMALKYGFEYIKDYEASDRWAARASAKIENIKEMDTKDEWSTGPLTMTSA